jgi:tryptophan-rich sensory protein
MLVKTIIFLFINFAALGIGGWLMGSGVTDDWYRNVNKAPWTPPGWVFGFAWTAIMICFSIYLGKLWSLTDNKKLLIQLFVLQFILNVVWNPIFFRYNQVLLGLFVITALTLLIWWFLIIYAPQLKWFSILILPYAIWMLIATSLNAYIWLMN